MYKIIDVIGSFISGNLTRDSLLIWIFAVTAVVYGAYLFKDFVSLRR